VKTVKIFSFVSAIVLYPAGVQARVHKHFNFPNLRKSSHRSGIYCDSFLNIFLIKDLYLQIDP